MAKHATVLVSRSKALRCVYTAPWFSRRHLESLQCRVEIQGGAWMRPQPSSNYSLTTSSYLATRTIEVVVGGEDGFTEQSFFVHRDLLTSRSSFFAKALKDYDKSDQRDESSESNDESPGSFKWREGNEGVVRLPVDDPVIFANYVQLLYTGALPIEDDPKKPMPDVNLSEEEAKEVKHKFGGFMSTAVQREYAALVGLYVFSEKVQDATSKRALLAGFVEASRSWEDRASHYDGVHILRQIYSGTLPGDPIRDFLVDCHVLKGRSGWLEGHTCVDYPPEFLFDMVKCFYEKRVAPKNISQIKDAKHYQDKLQQSETKVADDEPDKRKE